MHKSFSFGSSSYLDLQEHYANNMEPKKAEDIAQCVGHFLQDILPALPPELSGCPIAYCAQRALSCIEGTAQEKSAPSLEFTRRLQTHYSRVFLQLLDNKDKDGKLKMSPLKVIHCQKS